MKITFVIARILLGIIFVVFGLNGFLHFIPMGPMPTGSAGKFFEAITESHYSYVVFFFQLLGGVLLLANKYVPLAVTILGAVLVNIMSFHIFMAPAGIPLALFTSILWALVFWGVRQHFAGIFARDSAV